MISAIKRCLAETIGYLAQFFFVNIVVCGILMGLSFTTTLKQYDSDFSIRNMQETDT